MEQRRIFIAIDLSADARREVAGHIENLRRAHPEIKVGWERPEKLHITIKFLGGTNTSILETLESKIADIGNSRNRFRLRLSSTGVFPSRSRPRILWIGLDGDVRVASDLGKEIDDVCQGLGFELERREFRSHITIGRIRDPGRSSQVVNMHLEARIEPVEFEVSEIVTYESKLQRTGSVYSVVSAARLLGG